MFWLKSIFHVWTRSSLPFFNIFFPYVKELKVQGTLWYTKAHMPVVKEGNKLGLILRLWLFSHSCHLFGSLTINVFMKRKKKKRQFVIFYCYYHVFALLCRCGCGQRWMTWVWFDIKVHLTTHFSKFVSYFQFKINIERTFTRRNSGVMLCIFLTP